MYVGNVGYYSYTTYFNCIDLEIIRLPEISNCKAWSLQALQLSKLNASY